MKTTITFGAALFLALTTRAAQAQATSASETGPFHVDKVYQVGGKGNWDYLTVDSKGGLLYVPRTTHTLVIDANTGKTVADIQGQKQNHGVALAPEAGRGFITDGRQGAVIFDLKTNEVLGSVKTAAGADGILFDPGSGKVLVNCGSAGSVVPISPDVDPKSGSAGAAIEVGGRPEALASDGHGKVYVTLEDKESVAVIDTTAMKVVDKWSVSPGGTPVGLAIDREHRRLFIGCRNPQKLIVMSADGGKVLADFPIGAGCDGTQFDDGYIFASCRDGSLAVIREASPDKFELVQSLKTRPGAKTMGVDPATHTIYLPTAEFGKKLDARKRPSAKPDSFMILVVRRSGS
jgi:DNA-binding beta-propeller fold protein YncE